MADALFRKDIRRQKRELTAIRKARKPRNKPPDTLFSLSGEQGIRGFYLLRNRAVLPRCAVFPRIIPAR